MSSRKKPLSIERELVATLDHLNDSVQRLIRKQSALVEARKSVGVYFFRGVLYGLGFLFAIAIVIPFIVWLLQLVEWVPLIGDFVSQIVERIRDVSPMNGGF